MTKDQKTYLILGVGAVALVAWYQYRRTGSFSFGSLLGGQGTAGSGSLNTSFSGSSPGGTIGGGSTSISEAERLRLRGLATGAGSRGVCLFPSRWIDTSTAPYYGLCVTQAQFDKWVRTANWTSAGQPSLAYVQQVLSRP